MTDQERPGGSEVACSTEVCWAEPDEMVLHMLLGAITASVVWFCFKNNTSTTTLLKTLSRTLSQFD